LAQNVDRDTQKPGASAIGLAYEPIIVASSRHRHRHPLARARAPQRNATDGDTLQTWRVVLVEQDHVIGQSIENRRRCGA
jgi:hypothetical protein